MQPVLEAIRKPEDFPDALHTIETMLYLQGNANRQACYELLRVTEDMLLSATTPPLVKFFAVLITKELSVKRIPVFLSALASSSLLQTLGNICLVMDPKLPPEDKAKRLYPDNPALGNRYLILIGECIVCWAERHPLNSQRTSSKFSLLLKSLVDKGVILPQQEFKYFHQEQRKGSGGSLPNQISEPSLPNKTQMKLRSRTDFEKVLVGGQSQLDSYIALLKQLGEVSNLNRQQEQELLSHHTAFTSTSKLMVENSEQFTTQLNQQQLQLYFQFNELYTKEATAYAKFITQQKNPRVYVQIMLVEVGQLATGGLQPPKTTTALGYESGSENSPAEFAGIRGGIANHRRITENSNLEIGQRQPSMQSNDRDAVYNEYGLGSMGSQGSHAPQRPAYTSNTSLTHQRQQPVVRESNIFNTTDLARDAELNKAAVDLFLQTQQVNKTGFSSVRAQLERQKKSVTKPKFKSRSKSPANSNNVTQFMSTSANETTQLYLQTANIRVTRTAYSGVVVDMQLPYLNDVKQLYGGQTIQRLKKSMIKGKNILFEDAVVQIGFKSECILEEHSQFPVVLSLVLFIGNKSTERPVTELQLNFRGDRTNLLYSNPQQVSSVVAPGIQLKHELMIVPTGVNCGLVRCQLRYQYNSTSVLASPFFLPNSIIKLSKFLPLQKQQFISEFGKCKSVGGICRTQIFKLSRSFPPAQLKKYIVELVELTEYDGLVGGDPNYEYKLGCGVLVLDAEEYLLKIRVRANMSCVLQMATIDSSEDSLKYLRNFLQTIQFLLMHEQ